MLFSYTVGISILNVEKFIHLPMSLNLLSLSRRTSPPYDLTLQ